MTLIGISGKKKCGKTTIADHIQSLYPNRTFILSFADALKDEVCEALGVTREFLEKNKDDFRLLLQGWGTDIRRKHNGSDYWVRKYLTKVLRMSKDAIVVTPDVRFLNEARAIIDVNGILWRVEKAALVHPADIDSHISETELDTRTAWDAVIHNDDTIESLKQTITNILQTYKL